MSEALEPEHYLRERAQHAATHAPVLVTVIDATADPLPADDGSYDAAVVALVLCTVPDPKRALAELYRVIRPAGDSAFAQPASVR